MRNFAEPGPRFRAAAPNHTEALLEEPQAFQAVGEKERKKNQRMYQKLRLCFPRPPSTMKPARESHKQVIHTNVYIFPPTYPAVVVHYLTIFHYETPGARKSLLSWCHCFVREGGPHFALSEKSEGAKAKTTS